MRSVLVSLLLALIAFALVAILPAPLGVLSLLRALVFLFGAACLVAAILLSAQSIASVTTGTLRARQH
jgi:hypothetical protein